MPIQAAAPKAQKAPKTPKSPMTTKTSRAKNPSGVPAPKGKQKRKPRPENADGWLEFSEAMNAWRETFDRHSAAWLETEAGAAWRRALLALPRRKAFLEWHAMFKARDPECAGLIGLKRDRSAGVPRMASFDVSPGVDEEFEAFLAAERAAVERDEIDLATPAASGVSKPRSL